MTVIETRPGRYHIAEIARLSGFSPTALRYYEQVGVLAAPERTSAGYRLYGERDVERLRLIARAKDLGCTLSEITELARAWDGDECEPVKHRLRSLVADKVREVETHLAEQTSFAEQLRATARTLSERPVDGPCDDSCGCSSTPTHAPGGSERNDSGAPIACSLSGADMATRIQDWQRLLDTVVVREPVPDGVRLELGDRGRVTELARLVDAEQACCPFFSFAITVDRRGLALEVTAPPAGQELLATVFGTRP